MAINTAFRGRLLTTKTKPGSATKLKIKRQDPNVQPQSNAAGMACSEWAHQDTFIRMSKLKRRFENRKIHCPS